MPIPETIEALAWHDCIRKRPGMYLGGRGVLGLQQLLRGVLESGEDVTSTQITVESHALSIQMACIAPSVAVQPGTALPFLQDACSRLTVKPDHPPTVSLSEYFDYDSDPPSFTRVPQVTPALAIANALCLEFRAASCMGGRSTGFSFARGVPIGGAEVSPWEGSDGLVVSFTPDLELFDIGPIRIDHVAEAARTVASVRRRSILVVDPIRRRTFQIDGH